MQNGHNDVRRYLQSWKLSATECFIRKHVAKAPASRPLAAFSRGFAEVDSKSVENLVIMGDQMEPLPEVMSFLVIFWTTKREPTGIAKDLGRAPPSADQLYGTEWINIL